MPFTTVRDLRMHYEIRGSGPRVLFISGTGGDLRRSPNAFDWPLTKHFEVLAYDQRGLGQTDRPDIPYTMADYAADADALLQAVGWDRCMVIGVSFGGMVAQEFALRSQHRVEKLVLCCTSSGGAGGASYPLHEVKGLSLDEYAGLVITLADNRRDAAWQAAHQQEFHTLLKDTLAGLKIGADEPGRAMGARRQLEARKEHDTYSRLPTLLMPVLICGGRYDDIAAIDNQEAMRKQIPNARLELFTGGHLFFVQDPTAYERIVAFLQGKDNQ
ncbi:MAG: alpha/beta hydrolase [Deltaproteobacteria bacterium]|nr:alpha/beta hydrolase [Deltaproteobacteria bacterium]